MKLSELSKRPELVKRVLDDADTLAEYGEPIEFWTWDRQPMAVFLKLAAVEAGNYTTVFDAVRELVLDESGNRILTDEAMLPTPVMMRVITEVVEGLGKSSAQT